MFQLFAGSILLSLLHALLPNHWLPLLAIGRKEHWSSEEVRWVAFLCGLAHAFSTILIGVALGFLGYKLSFDFLFFSHVIAPALLVLLGVYFIYQHHRHHHFHMHATPDPSLPKFKIIAVLTTTMFLSPCLEVEVYFLLAGAHGLGPVFIIAIIYLVLSISGMMLWTQWAYKRSMTLNWHALEHNAGIITGITLIATGIISFFVS